MLSIQQKRALSILNSHNYAILEPIPNFYEKIALLCPKDHEILLSVHQFNKGKRCLICERVTKNYFTYPSSPNKAPYTQEYILRSMQSFPSRLPGGLWSQINPHLVFRYNHVITSGIYLKIGEIPDRTGEYELDHIYPVIAFLRACKTNNLGLISFLTIYHPDNYQWLTRQANLDKGNSYNPKAFMSWVMSKRAWVRETLLKKSDMPDSFLVVANTHKTQKVTF